MFFRKPKPKGEVKLISMDDRWLYDMTAEEKEANCQETMGKSYDQYIDDAFFDCTTEEREQIKRDWEYPKPE